MKRSNDEKPGRSRRQKQPVVRDRYLLYSAAVQSPEVDLDFFERIYRKRHGSSFQLLREDFCGTAALASEWVHRRRDHRAWGVDRDATPLAWGRKHYVPRLGDGAERLHLLREDVLTARTPRVDAVAALNFSFCVFTTRAALTRYFRAVRRSLRPGGIFFLDAFGGTDTLIAETERRRISASRALDGTRIPAFTYVWEQATFNPIDHHMTCHIHFRLSDGTRLRRAFSYEWRLWTLPEVREMLEDAGFVGCEIYAEGWDDRADESDGIFRRRTYFDNDGGWVVYLVAVT